MKFPRPLALLLIGLLLFTAGCQRGVPVFFQREIGIAFAEAPTSLSPLSYSQNDRRYLINIYEPLLRFDRSFNTETALAISWGRLDDLTWEFRLRDGVTFHNEDSFTAEDVVYSIKLARENQSDLGTLLRSIVRVEKVDDYRVQIETETPDPLLLNKLTNVFMVPENYTHFEIPVGTGPYRYSEALEDGILIERFENYWGELPYFPRVALRAIPRVDLRFFALVNKEVQFLVNVPPQYEADIREALLDVESFPGLEVSYLMMNTRRIFSNPNLRAAVWYAIGDDLAENLGSGYLSPTSQYAASGIFGYLPDMEGRKADLELAQSYRDKVPGAVRLTLDVPTGLSALAIEMGRDLQQIDMDVQINILPPEEYEAHILSGKSDLYFFGWKYDLADVSDFYEAVLHSKNEQYGEFNGIAYSNPEVDALIEDAGEILDVFERSQTLQKVLELSLADKVVLPLFESKVLYGLSPSIHWVPRLDGQVYASEIFGSPQE